MTPNPETHLLSPGLPHRAAHARGPRHPAATEDERNQITDRLRDSRDEKQLRHVGEAWHALSPGMRKDYARLVDVANKGARELGFRHPGAMWPSKYDMPADEFTKELDRLWNQVRPLY